MRLIYLVRYREAITDSTSDNIAAFDARARVAVRVIGSDISNQGHVCSHPAVILFSHDRPVPQPFCNMHRRYSILALQIGDRSGHLDHPMIRSR